MGHNLIKPVCIDLYSCCLMELEHMGGNAVGLNNNVAGHTNKRLETAVDMQAPSSQYAIFNIIELDTKSVTRYYTKQIDTYFKASFTKIILVIHWSHIHGVFRL